MDSIDPTELIVASPEVEVTVLPGLGARLHRLRAFGRDLLRTPPSVDTYLREPFFWGAFVMAPWCNRLDATATPVGDRIVELPANFPDGTAIHGQVHALPWAVETDGSLGVEAGGDGWPWRYRVTLRVVVEGARVRLEHGLANLSDGPMPAGLGIHPWFLRPLELAIPAPDVFPSNTASAPDPIPVAGDTDLRGLAPMPPNLDATWVTPSSAPVELRWPEIGITGRLEGGPTASYVCAASPATIEAVALEPQTHAPNGLRRLRNGEDGGLRLLAPGDMLHLDVALELSGG